MDDLLREFLLETNESLDTVDNQLLQFEQDPNNAKILDNIFGLVHTIKGTCGFLGLPRPQHQHLKPSPRRMRPRKQNHTRSLALGIRRPKK